MNTFKINYYLQTVKKDKLYHFILISVVWEGNRVRTTLSIAVEPNLWNANKQRVKASAKDPGSVNIVLDNLVAKLNTFYTLVVREFDRAPKSDEVKKAIKAILQGKEPAVSKPKQKPVKTLMQYFDDFINDSKTGERLSPDGRRIQLSTIKTYETTKKHLEAFLKASKYDLSFETVDEKFFASLTKYLSKKEMSNNSQGRVTKIIKTFMHDCFQKGLHSNLKFVKALRVFDEDTTIIALTDEEITRIEKLTELTISNEKCRNMFLLQIYTGLRYSDLANLKKSNIDFDNKVLRINTIKTKQSLIVPITSQVEMILKKYPLRLPVIANQKYNEHIKEVCRIAEIDTMIQLTHYEGNKRVDEEKPKYELVSSHTARRTFITLSLKMGLLPEYVMKVSGHQSRKSFQRYVKITDQEAIREVQNAWEAKNKN